MKSTLLHSFLEAAKLWQWLSNFQSPPIFQEIQTVFEKIYKNTHLYNNPYSVDPTHQVPDISAPKSISHDLKAMLNVSPEQDLLKGPHQNTRDILHLFGDTPGQQSCPLLPKW